MEELAVDLNQVPDHKLEMSNRQSDMSDEEEEVEPKLKYERLSNDIAHILKKDAASCISVHSKVSVSSNYSFSVSMTFNCNLLLISSCALEQIGVHCICWIILDTHPNNKNFPLTAGL